MNDDHFFDLAMKVIARQATEAERAELDALVARQPELKAEFERLQADVRLAREVLPLVSATEATAPELPAYARGRLQTKVRQTLGRPPAPAKAPEEDAVGRLWKWRWILGLAAATAVVVAVLVPVLTQPGAPAIQVAMLNTAGAVRGAEANDIGLLRQQWKDLNVQTFDRAAQLETWEASRPPGARAAVKVTYDRAAGEVRVLVHRAGKTQQKAFLVDPDLPTTLRQANAFIRQQTGK